MRLSKPFWSKMGNAKSKSKTKESRGQKQYQDQGEMQERNHNNNFSTEFGAAYDPELMRMRKELQKDQEAFILNNLLLCVQFFENYDQEILDIRARPVSSQENDLNTIISQSQKHVLLPDVLQEQVARHVKFTSTRQTLKPTIEPLQPVRMFVVLDNVDVNEIPEGPEYSILTDAIFYNMCLEPSSNPGFVKLRSLEVTPPMKSPTADGSDSDLSFIAEDDDEVYSKENDMFDPRMNPGEAFLSQVEKRMNAFSKSSVTRSMNDLNQEFKPSRNSDQMNRSKATSQTNLYGGVDQDDEETPERRLSGLTKPQSNQVLRSQISSSSKLKQLKTRKHSGQQQPTQRSSESSPASSGSSGYRSGNNYVIDSDSDYGYATITNFNTPKPLLRPANIPISSSEIPSNCFKKIIYTREGKVYNERTEKIQFKNNKQRRIKMALQRQNEDRMYLRSDEFMRYFEDLFANRLAEPLGFTSEDVDEATTQGSIIYCDMMQLLEKNRMLIVPHEILPSVPAEWPEYAREWLDRPRRQVLDPSSNLIYTWPTNKMIGKIKKFGCHIVPEGYMPKRQANPNHAVEWQLTFPAAERYLETCLSHAQVRVYLMSLMLHKTFIRPVDTTFGLTTSHIRTQLFWLLEQNYSPSMWPENRTGESLRRFLRKLYTSVSQSQPNLPDYFISSKNLFANIPRQYLLLTQKQLNRIIDNPVMYMIGAMENIRYKPEYFPVLNYKKLYKILTYDNADLVGLLNPALRAVDRPMQVYDDDDTERFEERFDRIGAFWVKIKTKEEKVTERKTVINRSTNNFQDLIVEIPQQCGELRGLRLSALLDMFIQHFIKMAERCYHYGALKQKDLYLNQSERLAVLLYEHPNSKDDAAKYLETISNLRNELARPASTDEAPETPKRNDQQQAFSMPFTHHFSNGQPSLFVPLTGETKEYDIYYAPAQRRPTVNFQMQTMQLEYDGSVTVGNVNDVELRDSAPHTGPRVVSLTEGNDEDTFLEESTYI